MRRFQTILSTILLVIAGNSIKANNNIINFSDGNIIEARKKAGEEGKLLFIDFHAKWCNPCKWMEQTTFKDPTVIKMLNDDFVALKIDIDDVQGFKLKNTYDIKYLPTMLIFNSQGQLVDRIEETLSPRLLMNVLDKHNAPENRLVIKHDFNISPSGTLNKNQVQETNQFQSSKEEYQKYYQQIQSKAVYRVQVGVFSRYEGANDMVTDLRELFLEPITVINEFIHETPIFKVRLGQFETLEAAEKFRKSLKSEYNMDGIIQE